MKKFLAFLSIFTFFLFSFSDAELVLIKYNDLGEIVQFDDSDKKNWKEIYDIFCTYKWPMCLAHLDKLSLEEKKILFSEGDRVEENFIKMKLKQIDASLDVVFIPDVIVELFCFLMHFEGEIDFFSTSKFDAFFSKEGSEYDDLFDFDSSRELFNKYYAVNRNFSKITFEVHKHLGLFLQKNRYLQDRITQDVSVCIAAQILKSMIPYVLFWAYERQFLEWRDDGGWNAYREKKDFLPWIEKFKRLEKERLKEDEFRDFWIKEIEKLDDSRRKNLKNVEKECLTFYELEREKLKKKKKEGFKKLGIKDSSKKINFFDYDLEEELVFKTDKKEVPFFKYSKKWVDSIIAKLNKHVSLDPEGFIFKTISLEYEKASGENKDLIFRGASGRKIGENLLLDSALNCKISKDCDGDDVFEYEDSGLSLSFGNSLFSGMFFDGDASVYFYLGNARRLGYALAINKKSYVNGNCDGLFFISPLGLIPSLCGEGEYFHSRSKSCFFKGRKEDFPVAVKGIESEAELPYFMLCEKILIVDKNPYEHAMNFYNFLQKNIYFLSLKEGNYKDDINVEWAYYEEGKILKVLSVEEDFCRQEIYKS